MEVQSAFFFRGRFTDYTGEPDYTAELITDVGNLVLKDWFEWADESTVNR